MALKECTYNNEPVYFCKKCLSLKIMSVNAELCYCEDCGSTDILKSHIEEWESLYKNKYKVKFLNKKNNGR